MNVLLVNPNTEETTSPHLGLGYIAAVLESKGVNVEIFDLTFSSWEIYKRTLEKETPKIVGITCNTLLLPSAMKAAETAKEILPDTLVAMGGSHPTVLPEEILSSKSVDVAVIGEGEETMLELVEGKNLEKIDGIAFKQGKKITKTRPRGYIENLDELPYPARHLYPMKKYLMGVGRTTWALPNPSTTIICSRGCPFQCTFCSSHLIFGRNVRFRSPENVISEIKHLKEEYKVRGIQFHDDTLTINRRWIEKLCDLIIQEKLDIEWFCNGRIGTVDKPLLEKMKNAGCSCITFGVESGNQWVLDNIIKKGVKLEDVVKTYRMVREVGITSHGSFMIGSPGETKEMIKETIEFAKKINPDIAHFSTTIPFPGTEIYEMAKERGTLKFESWGDLNFLKNAVFESDEFNVEYVQKTLKKAYISYYFRAGYMLQQLKSIKSLPELKRRISGIELIVKVLFA